MSMIPRPAREWHLGDVVVPEAGPPRTITLFRVEGAPGEVIVQYAGDGVLQRRYQPDHREVIHRRD